MTKVHVLIGLCALACFSCARAELPKTGTVKALIGFRDSAFEQMASSMKGMKLELIQGDGNWSTQLSKGASKPDLMLVYLDRELIALSESGLVMDLTGYWKRLGSAPLLGKALAGGVFDGSGKKPFLPATVSAWGLFANRRILEENGILGPTTLDDLEKSFEALKRNGVTPLALGAQHGWPALAWISILDMRMNGAEAHKRLLAGKRSFDDPGLVAVYEKLARWRDNGWIGRDAADLGWEGAFALVETGKAAFTYLDASAFSRYARTSAMDFMAVPAGPKPDGRAELSTIEGYAISGNASAPAVALALADAYVLAGAPGLTGAVGVLPAVAISGKEGLSALKRSELGIIEGAEALLPQLDWILPAQASYEARLAMTRFFGRSSGMDATALAAVLTAAGGQPRP